MLHIHKTQDGQRMYVSQMTDEHLLNFIKMQCKKIKSCSIALSATVAVAALQGALYGISTEHISNQAKTALPGLVSGLYPYLAEACLRGLTEATTTIQDALGRKTVEAPLPIELESNPRSFLEQSSLGDYLRRQQSSFGFNSYNP